MLDRLYDAHSRHQPLGWRTGTLSRSDTSTQIDSVLGTIQVDTWRLRYPDGDETTWLVESDPPHRIVEWQRSDGEQGVLTGSIRSAYWQRTAQGDEAMRSSLGLSPRN